MKTKELLEQAAKAAGIELVYHHGVFIYFQFPDGTKRNDWNPLSDDGDAFRLAINLNIGVIPLGDEDSHIPNCTVISFDKGQTNYRITEPHNGNKLSVTRRAIVRAAAEIGKSTVEAMEAVGEANQ